MEDREIRGKRKDEHLLLAQHLPDGPGSSGFENINLIHDSVPELDLEEIDLGYIFLGKKNKIPLTDQCYYRRYPASSPG
jgi:isopentenyl-diphosphate delta-isomerase